MLNGFDIDFAADQTRVTNRLRDALTSISRALERALGARLGQPDVRDLLVKLPAHLRLRNIPAGPDGQGPLTRLAETIAAAVTTALEAQSLSTPAETTIGRVVAETTVGRLVAELADGSRFATGDKLAAYAGLAPVTRHSRRSLKAETESRRGNTGSKPPCSSPPSPPCSPDSRAFYDRKRAEGKRHNAAIICLARRRCDVILAMLRTNQPYRLLAPSPWPRPPETSLPGLDKNMGTPPEPLSFHGSPSRTYDRPP